MTEVTEIEVRLIAAVREYFGEPDMPLSANTRVVQDLGVVGDDFDDFFDWFSDHFDLDLKDARPGKVRPPEPGLGLRFWRSKNEGYLPITLGDLARVIASGSWQASGLEAELKTRALEVMEDRRPLFLRVLSWLLS